jgi:hypothetical protein
MVGSSSPKEAHNARDKLNHLLAEHGLTWNDLPRILTADIGDTGDARDAGTGAAAPAATPTEADIPNVLCRRQAAALSDVCAARCRGDRYAAVAAAAPCCRNQHAAIECST